MNAKEFPEGTIIKRKVNLSEHRTGIIYAIAPQANMEINTALRDVENSDEGDLFGITTDGKICTYIDGLSDNYEKATIEEAADFVQRLYASGDISFKVMHTFERGQLTRLYVDINNLCFNGHKVYVKSFEPDELVLIKSHPYQAWTLARYSHRTSDNIHIVQPGVPVRSILSYKGNEHLLSK